MCAKIATAPYVRYLVKKVKDTGILIDKLKREKPKTVRTPENNAAVAESVCDAPSTININSTSIPSHDGKLRPRMAN